MTRGEKISRGSRINTGKLLPAVVLEKKVVHDGYIILCVILSKGEYVSWFMNKNAETYCGNYRYSLDDAVQNFKDRR